MNQTDMQKIKRFGPVWFVPGHNRGKYPHYHSIYLEGAGVLIDPASDAEILTQLKEGPGVKEVWLTHWHEDHLTHLDLFEDVLFKMPARNAPSLADLETFLDWNKMDEPATRDMWRELMLNRFHFDPRLPSGYLVPSEVMDLGNLRVELLPTPGHTPSHLSFLFREPEVLFLTDYGPTLFGPYYGELYADIEAVIDSVNYLSRIPAGVVGQPRGRGVHPKPRPPVAALSGRQRSTATKAAGAAGSALHPPGNRADLNRISQAAPAPGVPYLGRVGHHEKASDAPAEKLPGLTGRGPLLPGLSPPEGRSVRVVFEHPPSPWALCLEPIPAAWRGGPGQGDGRSDQKGKGMYRLQKPNLVPKALTTYNP